MTCDNINTKSLVCQYISLVFFFVVYFYFIIEVILTLLKTARARFLHSNINCKVNIAEV